MIRTLLLLLSLWTALPAICQDSLVRSEKRKTTITGTVGDVNSKSPLSKATVSLSAKAAKAPFSSTLTNEQGRFELAAPDTGTYILNITAVGYQPHSSEVRIITSSDLGLITMGAATSTLKEVVVKTDKPLIEQKADRLVYNAENDKSTLGGTAADVLRNVPMLSVDGNGNVQLRGSSNIRVLINNRPSSIMASSIADALRQIPADMVKTVEVITSPSAKYDAEGTAGVINIITKKNTLQGVTGSATIVPGNVSTIGNASLNYRRKQFGLNGTVSTNQFYNTGTTYLERYSYNDKALFIQDGKTRNRSGFINPQLGFDLTLDEKNSIGGGVRFSTSHDYVTNKQVLTNSINGTTTRVSNLDLVNRSNGTGYDFNLDYLRTFKDPQQEFSILTLYSIENEDNEANQDEFNPSKELSYQQRNLNESRNVEATLQADYTQPLKNKTLFEIGAKTVLRKATSDVDYKSIYPLAGQQAFSENVFSYNQDVWAAYITYAFKMLKKVNVKLGTRYENTGIRADFRTRDFSFNTGYDNLIPSINASYTFNEKHTLRAAFTQRLQRPQLFFLNPYREVIAPQIIRQGNPELDPELSNLYEINYGTYASSFSINASMYGRTTSNAIASVLSLSNDTSYIRFQNIARNETYGLSLSGSVKPVKRWSLNGNFNLYHSTLYGDNGTNQGWMYNFFVGSNLDLGKGWYHGFTGSFNSRRVTLQGRMAAFYYHNTHVRKDVLKKKGSVGINLANPFMKGTRVRNNLVTSAFEQMESNINYTRGIRLTLTYRFGTLQQAKPPRKPKKSINNDDALRG
jgi:outer membrane receptor protein involved in Fe transport